MRGARLGRRDFLRIAAALAMAVVLARRSSGRAPKPPARPNIVLILADDLGYECVGANGGTSCLTPTLDELARTDVRFEHCYAQPLGTPSRVQLLTGIHNVRNYVLPSKAPPVRPPRRAGGGTTAFVLGLLGLILCAVCAPFARSIGGKEKRRREQLGLPPEGMATAGYIMGIIGTVLLILGVVGFVIWLIVVLAFVGNMH